MQNRISQQPEDPLDSAVLEQDLSLFRSGYLPGPNDAPARPPEPQEVGTLPTHIDANYLEFSLGEQMRGAQLLCGAVLVAIAPVHLWMAIGAWSIPDLDNAAFLIFALLTGLLLPVFGIDLIRSDIERPYFFTLRFLSLIHI